MDGDTNINANNSANSSFSAIVPKLQTSWDATSYNSLCECPRKYELSIINGYRLGGDASDDLTFGIIFHSARETYERWQDAGHDHDKCLIEALRTAITLSWDAEQNRPWVSFEPTKTRNTLLRTIVWYFDQYHNDTLKTHTIADKPAIEQHFRFGLGELSDDGFRAPTGEEYNLCGYLDKAVDWNEEVWIVDTKTTKYELDDTYFKQYDPDNQISLYSIAGYVILRQHVNGVIIDGVQTLVNGSRFRRKQIPRSQFQLEEWLRDFHVRMKQNEQYVADNYWPQNPKSCGYGRRQCQFRPVCSCDDPGARQDMLDNFYTKRIWDPLQPR